MSDVCRRRAGTLLAVLFVFAAMYMEGTDPRWDQSAPIRGEDIVELA